MTNTNNMKYDKVLGWGLLILAFFISATISISIVAFEFSMPWNALIIPSAIAGIGVLLIAFDVVEDAVSLREVLQDPLHYFEDDIKKLFALQFTWNHGLALIWVASIGASFILFQVYGKWSASWWGISVFAFGFFICAILAWFAMNTRWFAYRRYRSPKWVVLLPILGTALCVYLGIYYTEPMETGGSITLHNQHQIDQSVDTWQYTRAGQHDIWYYRYISSSTSSPDIDFDCSGDSCEGIAIIIVILIFVALSYLVTQIIHFWMIAVMIGVTMTGLLTLRELLMVEEEPRRRFYFR